MIFCAATSMAVQTSLWWTDGYSFGDVTKSAIAGPTVAPFCVSMMNFLHINFHSRGTRLHAHQQSLNVHLSPCPH